jgi:endonuclease/exonuclease/phosphatase family metal-dependent hydrolase
MSSRGVSRVAYAALFAAFIAITHGPLHPTLHASGADLVLYAADATVVRGNWAVATTPGAAADRSMTSADLGWSSANAPLASPTNYFEITFDAPAATTYRIWLRLRATGNSKWNDAVWVQFSDSTLASGASAYRIGTTTGLMVNLERCSGCGVSGWGWQNTAYWLTQSTEVRFAAAGQHTLRVQTREDGAEIDQIVLSPVTYAATAPGALINDTTIVPKPAAQPTEPVTAVTSTPFKGTPVTLPGTIEAADFDNGGKGVAFNDTTAGNAGTVYRTTDVDLQAASCGGYNVGWTIAGEWLNYSVNVTTAGTYNVELRVAAVAATSVDVTSGNAAAKFAVPNTGGWQNWSTVVMPMTLAAGPQVLRVAFPSGGVNLRSVVVATPPAKPAIPSGTGASFRMMTWNVHHGKNKSNVLSVPAQAQLIASQNVDVAVLQEVQTWDQNQPALFRSELERLTGVKWYVQWAPVQPSTWTEGNVVLTRLPVVSSTYHQMHATSDYTVLLANRSVAQARVLVGGVPVDVFSTHLDYANTTYRTAQLLDMMAWVGTFSARRVVGGDFNSTPGTYWITTMSGDYYDTWHDITGSTSGGGTINGVRFDYLWRAKTAVDTIKPTSIRVLTTTLSDHMPVVADYTVYP